MTFAEACQVKIEFGQYRGRTIGDIGITGAGLLYLDELSGRVDLSPDLEIAIFIYLSDESIAAELDALTGWAGPTTP